MKGRKNTAFCNMQGMLQFCLGMLLVLSIAACNSALSNSSDSRSSPSSSDCRIVQHAKGETCIPIHPQRIVVLGGLDYALSLGVKPIASDEILDHEVHLNGRTQGIENVGGDYTPNFEKILTLKPDLILGGSYLDVNYSTLSSIAPTVLLSFEHSGKWKSFLMNYATVLDKTEKAEAVIKDYDARLKEFKRRMGNQSAQTAVSVVRVYPTHVNLYLKDSFAGTILADAGLSRPPSQDLTAAAAKQLFSNQIQYTISRERLQDADADVIFLWSFGSQGAIAQQAQTEKEKLKADPLWATLKAVGQNRVYEVPGYWIGDGPIAANAVIDDLFKYLIQK